MLGVLIPRVEIEGRTKFGSGAGARVFQEQHIAALHVTEDQLSLQHFAGRQKLHILRRQSRSFVELRQRFF